MGVAESGVRDGQSRLLAQGAGEALRALLHQHLTPPCRRGGLGRAVERAAIRLIRLVPGVPGQLGPGIDPLHPGTIGLIDGDIGQILQCTRTPVLTAVDLGQFRVGIDEVGGHIRGDELRRVQHIHQERDVGGHSANAELRQRTACPTHRRRIVPAAAGELDQHAVEVRADLRPGVHGSAVQTHPGTASGPIGRDRAGVRTETVGRILRGDPALQSSTTQGQPVLRDPDLLQGLPGGDAQLGRDQIDVGDLLGHRVLDLDARIHLDEHMLTGTLTGGVHQELHGSGILITHLLGELHRIPVQRLPDGIIQVRGRSDLHDLLMTTLQGAVALEQVHHIALPIGQDLDLDVARPQHRLLQEHRRITEGRLSLPHCRREGLLQRRGHFDPSHATPASPGHGLDEDREADLLGLSHQPVDVRAGLGGLQRGDARALGGPERLHLVPRQLQHIRRRTDKGDPLLRRGTGQPGVL